MSILAAPSALDNTALTRFAVVGQFPLLQQLVMPVVITATVRGEAQRRGLVGANVNAAVTAGWMTVDSVKDLQGLRLISQLWKKLDKGESESIAYLVGLGGGTFVTDDFRAYQEATARGLQVVSSLWLLFRAVQVGSITPLDYDTYTNLWVADGQSVPRQGMSFAKASALFSAGTPVSAGGIF